MERKQRRDATLLKDGVRLGDFATNQTYNIFNRLDMDSSFLLVHPGQWNDVETFQAAKCRIQQLQVVNDTAERGVKLFEAYNTLLTNDEEEKQFLLQVVKANRKAVPTEARCSMKCLWLISCDIDKQMVINLDF